MFSQMLGGSDAGLYDVILIRLPSPGRVGAAERAMKLEGMFGVS